MFFFLSDTLKKVHAVLEREKKLNKLKELGKGVVDKLPKPDHALFFLC